MSTYTLTPAHDTTLRLRVEKGSVRGYSLRGGRDIRRKWDAKLRKNFVRADGFPPVLFACLFVTLEGALRT